MSNPHPRPTNAAKPVKAPATDNQVIDEDEESGSRFLLFNVMPSWMVSFLTHIAVIVVLAIIYMPKKEERTVVLQAGEQAAEPMDSFEMDLDALEFTSEDAFESEIPVDTQTEVAEEIEVSLPEPEFETGNLMASMDSFDTDSLMGPLNPSDMSAETSSRTGQSKDRLLKQYGGTPASEAAVALALEWIVKHQLPDGGWSFDHTRGPGDFRNSPDPGELADARAGATAMALLPLLGAGHTHQTGKYKEQVDKGLRFLIKRARKGAKGVSYRERGGTMYSHGLVAIVFGEAYAMSKDPELGKFAQATIWYIEHAQDPIGGGWRYKEREQGDTSAVGWQMMALKSGKISGLSINPKTYKLAEKFLDSVSTSGGAYYGYTGPPRRKAADARTAVGLLCRMYMGWGKKVPGMVDGMAAISDEGPSENDMYYNYYATQAMKHIGGRQWTDWNNEMRDHLLKTQEKGENNKAGSWHFETGHASQKGGRLYTTSLACMTLEVYYRYLPLYGDSAANDEFPLD